MPDHAADFVEDFEAYPVPDMAGHPILLAPYGVLDLIQGSVPEFGLEVFHGLSLIRSLACSLMRLQAVFLTLRTGFPQDMGLAGKLDPRHGSELVFDAPHNFASRSLI
jgi:hypothetical protein